MKAPVLFSFVTLRRERLGGILFNPFLPVELELDDVESFLAGLCTGTRSCEEIRKQCQDAFGMSKADAKLRWERTLDRMLRAGSLGWKKKIKGGNRDAAPVDPMPSASLASFSAPKSVIWDVTYACNLKCSHCLTDSGRKRARELSTEQAFRLIDVLAEAKVLYLSLTGGEPFLRPDIVDILEHIAGTGMRVDIASNGFDVPEGVIRALRRLPVFQVQVSLDGLGAHHDRFRGCRGAFERACATLRRLKAEGLSISVSTTATSKNIGSLGALIDLAVSLGCDAFKAIPFLPAGRGRTNHAALALGREGSHQLCRTLTEKSRQLAGRISISTESTFMFLLESPSSSLKPDRRHVAQSDAAMICSAGYDELSIGADGTAYPCPFLRDFPLGNLLEQSMNEVWHDSAVLSGLRSLRQPAMTGPCRTCRHAPLHCRGGCRAAAYLAGRGLNGSDPLCFKARLTPAQ